MSNGKPRNFVSAGSLLLTFALLGNAPSLHAQAVSIASVTGRVTDQQGAVLTGTQIKAIALDTGTVHNAVTNEDGIYTIPSLPIGAYTFQAGAPGFQTLCPDRNSSESQRQRLDRRDHESRSGRGNS